MLMKHDTIEFQVSDVSSEHLLSAHRHSFCCETTIHYGHFPIAIGKERTKLKLFPENACSKLDLMPTQMALFCRPCLGWNRRLVYLDPHKKSLQFHSCQLHVHLPVSISSSHHLKFFKNVARFSPAFLIYYFSFLICFPSTFFRCTDKLGQSGAVLIFVDVIHAISIWLFILDARTYRVWRYLASLRKTFLCYVTFHRAN